MKVPVVEWDMTVLPPHFADLHRRGVSVPDHVQLLQGQAVLQPQAIRPRPQEPRRLAGALPQEHQGEQVHTTHYFFWFGLVWFGINTGLCVNV